MKDLLLCVHVVIKTLNLEISRCHLARYVTELYKSACRTCSTIIFPHSTNQIIVFWRHHCRWCRPCLSSLIGSLRNHDFNGNKNVANLCIWQWKTIDLHALHVQFSFLYISQTFSLFPRCEMTCFAALSTSRAYDDKCSILPSYLWSAGCNLIPRLWKHILQAYWLC